MPRPSNGYKNAAGQPVPGTTTITKRYGDSNGLIIWAHQEGLKGNRNLYATAADIGTAVHKMCELDLRGASEREIQAVPGESLSTREDINKACNSFNSFREWRKEHSVQAIAFEESLVSEALQYGGTFDIVAMIDGQRSLLDFKTCKDASRFFLDQKITMAAHANLWHEKHPNEPIEAYHLIMLPKDGSKPVAHCFADLSAEWQMFICQRTCYALEKGTVAVADIKRATAAPAQKVTVEPPKAEPPKPNHTSKLYLIAAEPETAEIVDRRPDAMAELRDFAGVYTDPNIKPVPAPVDALRDLREITRHARTAKVK